MDAKTKEMVNKVNAQAQEEARLQQTGVLQRVLEAKYGYEVAAQLTMIAVAVVKLSMKTSEDAPAIAQHVVALVQASWDEAGVLMERQPRED